ncbi:MAG: Tol-Pal system beta propeller repeat protein TolB [Nitrospiraceae bacterium]
MRPIRTAPLIAYLVLGAGLVGIMESAATDVFLEATRPDFQKIPIGVLEFQGGTAPDRAAERVAEVLKADLRRSQIFSVTDLVKLGIKVDEKLDLLNGAGLPLLRQAADNGVAVLVWGKMATRDADLVFDGYVYDGGSAELLIGKRYVGRPPAVRLMAHRLADELVARYTGEPGIAKTKIAYVSDQGGGRELFVMDYDGYAPRQVTADGFLDLTPQWSPDRRSLVFTAYRNRRNQTIEVIELATGKRRTLVALAGLNITPALSPDGRYLAFATSQDGNSEIYTLDMRTNVLQRLTFQAAGDLSPFWSPSGRELAFTSDRGGGPQIYIMNADGSNVRRLTFEGDYNAAPAWSPRGDWIAFVCRTLEARFKLCLITPDGQKRLQITTGPGIDDSPSWSPDGRHVVYSSMVNDQSHIFMINRDGTEQERLTSGGMRHSSPSWSPA